PDRLAYTFLADGSLPTENLNYGELHRRALAIAGAVRALAGTGERALLLYPAGLEFLVGFFGCMYAGVVAIPAPPPEASRLKRTVPRLRSIVEDADASLILTTSQILSTVQDCGSELFGNRPIRWLDTDSLQERSAGTWEPPSVADTHPAYLQY